MLADSKFKIKIDKPVNIPRILLIPQVDHRQLWQEIEEAFHSKRRITEDYIRNKKGDLNHIEHPVSVYLNKWIFPLLNEALIEMFQKMRREGCLMDEAHFNGLDFVAEYLWNMNPKHPKRRKDWTHILNIVWQNLYEKPA